MENQVVFEKLLGRPEGNGCRGSDSDYCGNIYPLIYAIYYVNTVEIVEIEKQYKQECV